MKKYIIAAFVGLTGFAVSIGACTTDADVASENIDKAAEQFEIHRHIAFYNGVTDNVFLEVWGFCSYENQVIEVEIICKDEDGPGGFSNHSMGLSDNVTYLIEQTEPLDVSTSRPRIVFKPEALIPDITR